MSNSYVQPFCYIHEDEVLCKSSKFYYYNSSFINNNTIGSVQTFHLINAYYLGRLNENINKIIFDEYPHERFPFPFMSSSKLAYVYIEHSALQVFPPWLCTYNRNLSFIEINYSHIEEIVEHDMNLCLNLHVLRITNSYLKRFINSDNVETYINSLYLSNNKLFEISNEYGLDLLQFPHLNQLDLSYNDIKKISSEDFNQTLQMKILDLSNNNLEYFQLNNLKYLTLLEMLDLRNNTHLQINENWYDYLPHLIKIYLPYAYFCCNYKNNLRMLNEKHSKKSSSDQIIYKFIDENEQEYKNENPSMSISFESNQICFPLPDEMTPCESLFPSKLSRFIFLSILCVSVISNLTALIVTLYRLMASSYNRWIISMILSFNLALADFISSIYLGLVGIIDIRFHDNFHIKTQLWTDSHLCTLAGFIYVFGIQSSIYALTLLTFERFYTILYSFKRQIPWPTKFTLTFISLGWALSLFVASLPLININNFHANSLCVPFRIETLFDRLYLSLLIIFDLCFIGVIITCNGLICFNFSKSHVHTLNDARATLKILILVMAICISRIPLIIFIFLALIIYPTYSLNTNKDGLHFNDIKVAILFLQPFSACFNPFMYSALSTLRWTRTSTEFQRPKPKKKSNEYSFFRSKSSIVHRGYHPLRMMSVSSLDYRCSSSQNAT